MTIGGVFNSNRIPNIAAVSDIDWRKSRTACKCFASVGNRCGKNQAT